ncbi:hypothetical protein DYB34_008293 [Aphanomyces astaci]|uniref:Uncharacterized protein n=1 Tax=Aphanomyces astaci TaxID=112090 RepID=A0A418C937_APHAT|nr:hypothetical protein DYB34_008293 [Aphanomyces astaci]
MGSRPAPATESTQESKRRAGLERRSPWYVDPRGGGRTTGCGVLWDSVSRAGDSGGGPGEAGMEAGVGVIGRGWASVSRADNFLDGKGAVPCASQLDVVLAAVAECMGRNSGLVKEDLVGDLEGRHVGTAAPIGFSSLSLLGGG